MAARKRVVRRTRTVERSAGTGRFVRTGTEKRNPGGTVRETVKVRRKAR